MPSLPAGIDTESRHTTPHHIAHLRHEFNNALAGCAMYAQLLREEVTRPDGGDRALRGDAIEYLDRLDRLHERMATLVASMKGAASAHETRS